LPPGYYAQLDCDAALNARDGDALFVADWKRRFQEVEDRWATAGIAVEARVLAEEIRREAFLAASRATGQHEIASYVSDDFDLMVRARLVGVRDELLVRLWGVYERGQFPTPPF
jgi:hypothetical protein